jgi:AAHS family 4-hydroxybenzoate transporter-like MFS transporter
MANNVEVSKAGAGLNLFHAKVFALLALALLADSYDLQATSFAAPVLAKLWHVKASAFAPLFGAGLAGAFVGSAAFGWIGDKFGRKRAIVLACLVYGGFSLICTFAQDPMQFAILRFFMGLGCGGALPNAVSLGTELAPARRRGALTALIFVAMPIGGAVPGFVRSMLVPDFGWQMIFIIGGVAPIVFASLIALALPESPQFLAGHKSAPSEPASNLTFGRLLSREFIAPTLLLWVMFTATLLTLYLVSNWLPTILEQVHVKPSGVATINFLYATGGALAGIALSLVIDRIGLLAVASFFFLGIASVLLVAFSEFSESGLAIVIFICGFAVTGVQYALNVSAGLIYPAEIRSSGVGAGLGVGRIGSVIGALSGGLIVGDAHAARDLFLLGAASLGIGAIASLMLMRRHDLSAGASQ